MYILLWPMRHVFDLISAHAMSTLSVVYTALSHEVLSGSDIMSCNKMRFQSNLNVI